MWGAGVGAGKESSSEWVERIRRLLTDLKLSQAGLAERLGVSPPTVSRWLLGRQEPTAESYVALGNLARPPEGIYFWERAGMDTSGLLDAGFREALSSLSVDVRDFKLIVSEEISHHLAKR